MDATKAAKIKQLLASVEAVDNQVVEQEAQQGLKTSDLRWSSFPPESQEVLLHFGINGPHKLNVYCCSVEDALIDAVEKLKAAQDLVETLEAEIEVLSATKEDLE